MQRAREHGKFDELQLAVLRGISIGVGLLALLSAGVNWVLAGQGGLSLLQLAYALLAAYCIRRLAQGNFPEWLCLANLAVLMSLLLVGVWVSRPQSGLFYAAFTVPLLFHVFLPLRQAAWVCGVAGGMVFMILWRQSAFVPSFMLYNFAVIYLAFWVIAATYERSRQQIHRQLEFLVLHDVMTTARNRQALIQDFALLARRQGGYALMLDIDYFKRINDSYGHLAGDEVIRHLVSTAQQLHDEALVYRIGGEEFLLLMPDCTREQGEALAERLRTKIEQEACHYAGQDVSYTVSIGVAAWLADEKLEQLLHDADDALYAAKRGGRNRVVVHADLPASLP